MKNKYLCITLICFLGINNLYAQQKSYEWKTASSGGYTYKYVTNDPSKSRFYTLKNGLTVILSENREQPTIEYRMAVRAGSNTDPREATGLAHYLEHLLFKGTDKFGVANYEKEKPLLTQIDALYEQYNKTKDEAKRKEIYKEIDKLSGEASNFSIANEYDKMMAGLGGNSTNAHTWYEETVYNEDFPSNAIDPFLALQSERFRNPVFRIFHTELEAVYEEKNRSLDNDGNKLDEKMMRILFPSHNYGQQSTIGEIEHLKNPSLVEIRKYYDKYYIPNNMAAIFAGDFNADEMIKKIDQAFSYMRPKPLELYNPKPEAALQNIQTVEVFGPSAEKANIYYRGYAANSKESMLLGIIRSILFNGKAGLIDIQLNKQQKVLRASAGYQQMKDYGVFSLGVQPKEGQSLEEATKLLLEQIEALKQGKFEESLLKAIAANNRLGFMQAFDRNSSRAEMLSDVFILSQGKHWDQELSELDQAAKITKNEIVAFANQFFKDNYIIGYKRKGEDKNMVKVEKPEITPINPNSNLSSDFVKDILGQKLAPISPKFLDYQKDIQKSKAGIADVLAVKNKDNSLFSMSYRFEFGNYSNPLLTYAVAYLPFLGTDKYTAEELSKAFYDIACSYSINIGDEFSTINIVGLQENFDKALSLVEHILSNVKADNEALSKLKSNILKNRQNSKANKGAIMMGLTQYAKYGKKNPFNDVLSNETIQALDAEGLVKLLKDFKYYEHVITYYGPKESSDIALAISKIHMLPQKFATAPQNKEYTLEQQNDNKVFFSNYDMVQSEIRWYRNVKPFDKNELGVVNVFNNYFGAGMGSVVFQTIRESKALAYSTSAIYSSPDRPNRLYGMMAYVGSQADKMTDAVNGMNELLNTLPENLKSFDGAKTNAIKFIETQRITKSGIFNAYFADKRMGFNHDSREDLFKQIQPLTFNDIKMFHQKNIANKPYSYLIIASDKRVKQENMEKFGKVTTLSLEEVFGY